jgi:hypothetical protein
MSEMAGTTSGSSLSSMSNSRDMVVVPAAAVAKSVTDIYIVLVLVPSYVVKVAVTSPVVGQLGHEYSKGQSFLTP